MYVCMYYFYVYSSKLPSELLVYRITYISETVMPIPVVERSKAGVCNRSPAGIAGSNAVGGMDVCLLSCRGLCDGLITRPEESYRLCRVTVCDLETSRMRRLKPASGL
jgi:hypothetical protein